MIHFIVQARMGSTRLPNKILRPFYGGKSILDILVEKLRGIPDTKIIIATSINENNDIIEQYCKENGVLCYRGSENDVLQRFIDAAKAFGAKKLIRVCSDNPFLELQSIITLVNHVRTSSADYVSFNINGTPSIKTHFGFWTEYTTLEALKKVKTHTDASLYHEHVTNFIYANPELFKIEWLEGPACLNGRTDIRLTCDTLDDFQNCSRIYASLCSQSPTPSIEEVVNFLDEHEEYKITMIEQIKENSK